MNSLVVSHLTMTCAATLWMTSTVAVLANSSQLTFMCTSRLAFSGMWT